MSIFFRSIAICCGLTLTAAESVPATVVVDATKPGLTIPKDFLGISYEKTP